MLICMGERPLAGIVTSDLMTASNGLFGDIKLKNHTSRYV